MPADLVGHTVDDERTFPAEHFNLLRESLIKQERLIAEGTGDGVEVAAGSNPLSLILLERCLKVLSVSMPS